MTEKQGEDVYKSAPSVNIWIGGGKKSKDGKEDVVSLFPLRVFCGFYSSNEDSSSDDSDHKYRTRKTKSSKSKKEDERKKKKKKKKKKSSRRAHSSEEISHVNPNPIQDLSRLRIGREYDVRPDEIQYGELIGQGGFGSVYRGETRTQRSFFLGRGRWGRSWWLELIAPESTCVVLQ